MYASKEAKKIIKSVIEKALGRALSPTEYLISTPPNLAMGDFAFGCFELSKLEKKSPVELAKLIAPAIKSHKYIEDARATGPYINIFVKDFCEAVLKDVTSSYGASKEGKGKKIFFEYSQPNTHKSFHIGHLRGTMRGQTLVNCYRTLGYGVKTMNYSGDIGSHINQILLGLERHPEYLHTTKNRTDALGRLYAKINNNIESDKHIASELLKIKERFDEGDKELQEKWQLTRQWSIEDFNEIYKELGVSFDRWYFESEVDNDGRKIVNRLLKQGVARQSDGAIIFDLSAEALDVVVAIKEDGQTLYVSRDLALAYKKIKDFGTPHLNIIQSDVRQQFYFKQLFSILKKAGFEAEKKHISYNFVTLPQGTMSSRKGNVIAYTDLRDELIKTISKETKQRHPDWNDKRVEVVSHTIAIATLIFEMMKVDSNKKITFDKARALSFEGFTASYLLYTVARINSLLEKGKRVPKKTSCKKLSKDEERELMLRIARYPEILEETIEQYNPAHLVQYLYDVAKAFSTFYHTVQIIGSSEEKARLVLAKATKQTLENGLAILSIKTLTQM